MGWDTWEGRHLTSGKGEEHNETPDHLLQMYPREIIGGRIFCFGTTTKILEEGEDASAPTIWINADPILSTEEYETEVEVSGAKALT